MSPASGFEQFHHVNQAAQVRHSQGDSLEKVRCLSAHCCSTAYHASEHCHTGDCCVLDEPCYRRGDLCAAGRHRGALAAFAICRRQLKVSNSISEESEEKPFMRKALVVALSLFKSSPSPRASRSTATCRRRLTPTQRSSRRSPRTSPRPRRDPLLAFASSYKRL